MHRAIVVVLAIGLAGCGGGSSSKSGTSTSTQAAETAGAGNKLSLAADPGGQLKYDRSKLVASAGRVTIDFTNSSPVAHDVAIQSGTSGPTIGSTPVITGANRTLTVSLKPGSYTFFCTVPGHRAAGMVGTLTVR